MTPLVKLLYFYLFWQHSMAYGILVFPAGIKPGPLVVKAQFFNHRTSRKFPKSKILIISLNISD